MGALVAKSYQNLEQVSEIYAINGKNYVKVRMNNGSIKQVRAYSESEYRRYNPEIKIIQPARSMRDVYGFGTEGYIWIFKGNTYASKDWFKSQGAKYNKNWGWAFPSDKPLPEPMPVDIEPVKLLWDKVSDENGSFIPEKEIKEYVDSLIYEESVSDFIGDIGDKIEVDLICDKAYVVNGYYGTSVLHSFHDVCDNIYIWSTTSKMLEEGHLYHIKGTVKDHKTYKNQRQTVLRNCRCEEL